MKNIKDAIKILSIVILLGIIFVGFGTAIKADETPEEIEVYAKIGEINREIDSLEIERDECKVKDCFKSYSERIERLKAYKDDLNRWLHQLTKS